LGEKGKKKGSGKDTCQSRGKRGAALSLDRKGGRSEHLRKGKGKKKRNLPEKRGMTALQRRSPYTK